MRPIDVYLSKRSLLFSSTRASWAPGSLPPLRMARLDNAAGSLLGSPCEDPAIRLSSPGDLAFHDAPSASVDRPVSPVEYSSTKRRTIDPLTPLSRPLITPGR